MTPQIHRRPLLLEVQAETGKDNVIVMSDPVNCPPPGPNWPAIIMAVAGALGTGFATLWQKLTRPGRLRDIRELRALRDRVTALEQVNYEEKEAETREALIQEAIRRIQASRT